MTFSNALAVVLGLALGLVLGFTAVTVDQLLEFTSRERHIALWFGVVGVLVGVTVTSTLDVLPQQRIPFALIFFAAVLVSLRLMYLDLKRHGPLTVAVETVTAALRGPGGRKPLTEAEIATNLAKVAEIDEYRRNGGRLETACAVKNFSKTQYSDWSKVAEIDQHAKEHQCDIETACKALGYDPEKHYYRLCKIRRPKPTDLEKSEKSEE